MYFFRARNLADSIITSRYLVFYYDNAIDALALQKQGQQFDYFMIKATTNALKLPAKFRALKKYILLVEFTDHLIPSPRTLPLNKD